MGLPLYAYGILLVSIIIHEIAHGYVALRFGDPTAKNEGRLTLNPIPHIDPLGSFLLPGMLIMAGSPVLIGWAKPVPVQTGYFKHPLRDMMWVALAGPLSNISLALMASILLKQGLFPAFFSMTILINLVLALFNLFPLPPLDGSKVLLYFLPNDWKVRFLRLEPYGFLIIFALAYFGFFSSIMGVFLTPLYRWLL